VEVALEDSWYESTQPWVFFATVVPGRLERALGVRRHVVACMHCLRSIRVTVRLSTAERKWPEVQEFMDDHRHIGREALAFWEGPPNVEGYAAWRGAISVLN
jgi:hypothetical protein